MTIRLRPIQAAGGDQKCGLFFCGCRLDEEVDPILPVPGVGAVAREHRDEILAHKVIQALNKSGKSYRELMTFLQVPWTVGATFMGSSGAQRKEAQASSAKKRKRARPIITFVQNRPVGKVRERLLGERLV